MQRDEIIGVTEVSKASTPWTSRFSCSTPLNFKIAYSLGFYSLNFLKICCLWPYPVISPEPITALAVHTTSGFEDLFFALCTSIKFSISIFSTGPRTYPQLTPYLLYQEIFAWLLIMLIRISTLSHRNLGAFFHSISMQLLSNEIPGLLNRIHVLASSHYF